MNRYSAQKQYWKAKQTKQDKEKIADVVLLQKLQVRVQVCAPLCVGTGALTEGLSRQSQWAPWRSSGVFKAPAYKRQVFATR